MIYQPLSGEGLYDIAAKLYQDTALGIGELLALNPGIDVNADLFGTGIIYTAGLTRKKPVIDVPFLSPHKTYAAHSLQSHFDLAIQLYGDISKIGNILPGIADINGQIALGTEFEIPEQTDPQAVFFLNKVLATDISLMINDTLRKVDTNDLRVTNTGDFRKVA